MFRFVLLASAAAFSAAPAFAQSDAPMAPIVLEEISVTANLTPTPTQAVGSAVTIISREELEQRQVRLVSDALRSVPGVSVNRNGGAGGLTQVRIRGSEANQTLVLIDGIEVNDPAGGSEFNFAHLLVQDIERIEVLRGPQSALYGSDAIGGVVNIVSRKGEGPTRGSAYAEGGTRATAAGGASLSGSSERVDYFFSAAGLRTDGFSAGSEWRGNTEKDGYENFGGFAKLGFQALDNLRFDFVGRGMDYYAESDDEAFGSGAYDFLNDVSGKQAFGRAQAKLDLFDGKWQQILGASQLNHLYDFFYFDKSFPTKYDGEKTKFDYRSNLFLTSGTDFDHTLSFVAEHEIDSAWSEGFSSFDEEVEQTGIAGEYKFAAWDSLFLTGSLRHDFNEGFEDATTYRLSAAYLVQETGTKFRTSYGTGVKNPSLFELYGRTPTFVPNPNLSPESAEGWDVGVDQALLDGRLNIDATYFDQRITDLIQTQGNTVVNLPGESKIHGVELGVSVRPIEDLTVRASFTWLDGEDADGVELIRRPEFSGSLDADYVFLEGRANLGLGIVYNGTQNDLPFWRPVVELDDFVLVNLRGGYKLTENTEIYARVENLFDEEYEEVYTFGGSGRLAIAGMRVNF
jgi:vitamin B12 transporter